MLCSPRLPILFLPVAQIINLLFAPVGDIISYLPLISNACFFSDNKTGGHNGRL